MSSRRLQFEWWGLLAVLIVSAIWLTRGPADVASGALSRLDLALFDFGKRLVGVAPAPDLVLVEIDEASLSQLGRWPWPRKLHAQLVKQLQEQGAKVLGVDLLLSEPSADDPVLAASFGQARVQLPVSRSVEADGSSWPVYPVLELGSKASIAHPHFRVDPDGNVRGLFLSEAGFPAFALGLMELSASQPKAPSSALVTAALQQVGQTQRNHALATKTWQGDHFVWLYPLKSAVTRYSYAQVLRNEAPKNAFRNKTVLIGANAEGLGDRYSSSLLGEQKLVVGVQLHSVAYSGLTQNRLIQRVDTSTEVLAVVSFIAVLLVLLYGTSPRAGLLLTLLFVFVWLGLVWLGLARGSWLPPAGAMATALAAYPLWSWRRLEAAVSNLRRQSSVMAAQPAWLSGFHPEERSLEPIARDLSALDRAAERLLQIKRFLSSVLDKLPHPAFVADLEGSIRLANPTAYQAFEDLPKARDAIAPSNEAASATVWLRQFFEDQPGILELTRDPLKTEKQIEARDKLGREWLVEVKPLGEPWKLWLVQFVDITRVKALQREREQMLAFLTHDIRSPQVTILSALSQGGESQHTEWAQTIEREARRGLNLAESYVQWARAEHKELKRDDSDLVDLCTDVIDSFWLKAEAQKVRVQLIVDRVGKEGAWAQLDQTLFRRVIANLVENALRFSPEGGTISVEIVPLEPDWQVEVRDQGPGISESDVERIFEPYVRGSQAGSVQVAQNDQIGAGLGLAFVRLVIHRHGGLIVAKNLKDPADEKRVLGAAFVFTVPASI